MSSPELADAVEVRLIGRHTGIHATYRKSAPDRWTSDATGSTLTDFAMVLLSRAPDMLLIPVSA